MLFKYNILFDAIRQLLVVNIAALLLLLSFIMSVSTNSNNVKDTRNLLPEDLKNHCYSEKYRYIDYDEELGVPLFRPGFVIDILNTPFISPIRFNHNYDTFEEIKSRTMEKGDYLLCCANKTGQHWVWEIMSMLAAGSAAYIRAEKETAWIDMTPLDEIYKKYETPRVLCSHLTLSCLPNGFRRDDTKVVVTLRNLKDTFVSAYCHNLLIPSSVPWPAIYRHLLYSKHYLYGTHFDFYADAWDNHRHNPNVLLVFYEELKQAAVATIEKIAKHMEVPYTPQLLSEIADAVDINKMKEGKQKIREEVGASMPFLYRKGQIGDWKNHFTISQNEEFDRIMVEWNKDRRIPFIYE